MHLQLSPRRGRPHRRLGRGTLHGAQNRRPGRLAVFDELTLHKIHVSFKLAIRAAQNFGRLGDSDGALG